MFPNGKPDQHGKQTYNLLPNVLNWYSLVKSAKEKESSAIYILKMETAFTYPIERSEFVVCQKWPTELYWILKNLSLSLSPKLFKAEKINKCFKAMLGRIIMPQRYPWLNSGELWIC